MFSIKNRGRILGNNQYTFGKIILPPATPRIIKEEEEEKPKRKFYQK